MRASPVVVLAGLLMVATATADEVICKNGDRISGKIERLDDGKIVVSSLVAGDVKIKLADVKTFATTEPLEVYLNDGTVIKQKIVVAEDGKFAVAKDGRLAPQSFAIADIKSINPPPVAWTGDLSVGGMITRGNSSTDNLNIALNLVRRGENDRITVGAAYLYGRQKDPDTGDKKTTTDNWFAAVKYDYFFTPKFYGYAQTRVERDRIAELDLRLTAGVGVGYQWVEKPDLKFSTEGGLTWFYESYTNDTPKDDHLALRLAYHLEKAFNDKVRGFHNLEYFPSIEDIGDYFLVTDAGLRATLTKNMFAELKVQLDYDSTPAEGAHNTNVRWILNVGWAF
jgi:putative salt-induced outer membrane protein YdiY